MKSGDLVKILWTDCLSDSAKVVLGIITKLEHNGGLDYTPRYNRMRALLYCQGSHIWIDESDLEVVNESR